MPAACLACPERKWASPRARWPKVRPVSDWDRGKAGKYSRPAPYGTPTADPSTFTTQSPEFMSGT
ncbi:MAG: hypothetical protein H6Q77_31 [Gemmatimonadetes bacterium]|jgi:hypothetical protein|nr:hypothetical protein [Gemmatimonadota bacterium]